MNFTFYSTVIAAVAVITVASCNSQQNTVPSIKIVDTVLITEDEVVLHHLPFSINPLSDSQVSFRVSGLEYCIYNYYTGKLTNRIELDSNLLLECLNTARDISHTNYISVSPQELKKFGLAPYELDNMIFEKGEGTGILFFNVTALSKDSIVYDGKKVLADKFNRIPFLATVDNNFNIVKSYYINSGDFNIGGITGAGKSNDAIFLRNIHSNNHGPNTITQLQNTDPRSYSVVRSLNPPDALSENLCKRRIIQMLSYSDYNNGIILCDAFKFFSPEGKILYVFNNKNPDEQIVSFVINDERIIFYTIKKDGDKASSGLYSYSLRDQKLELIKNFDNLGKGTFYKNQFIRLFKNGNYYFEIYRL